MVWRFHNVGQSLNHWLLVVNLNFSSFFFLRGWEVGLKSPKPDIFWIFCDQSPSWGYPWLPAISAAFKRHSYHLRNSKGWELDVRKLGQRADTYFKIIRWECLVWLKIIQSSEEPKLFYKNGYVHIPQILEWYSSGLWNVISYKCVILKPWFTVITFFCGLDCVLWPIWVRLLLSEGI